MPMRQAFAESLRFGSESSHQVVFEEAPRLRLAIDQDLRLLGRPGQGRPDSAWNWAAISPFA